MATSQVTTIAGRADAATTLTGEDRADLDFLYSCVLDLLNQGLINGLIVLNKNLVRNRVDNIFESSTPQNTIAQRLDNFTALDQGADIDAVQSTAIVFHNDCVLSNVNQTTGEVTRVSCLKRCIGQTFTGTVSRDEVLQNRKTFTEVCGNWCFDDRAVRLGHQTTHSGQLTNLLVATTSTGVSHHVNRVKGRNLNLFTFWRSHRLYRQFGKHRLGDIFGTLGPDIDDLIVTLAVGDQTFRVLFLYLRDFINSSGKIFLFVLGDHHIVKTDGNTCDRRELEAGLLKLIGQDYGLLVTGKTEAQVNKLTNLLLVHDAVYCRERNRCMHNLAQQNPANRGFNDFRFFTSDRFDTNLDLGLQIDLCGVVSHTDLFRRRENHILALGKNPFTSHVVETENHIL